MSFFHRLQDTDSMSPLFEIQVGPANLTTWESLSASSVSEMVKITTVIYRIFHKALNKHVLV